MPQISRTAIDTYRTILSPTEGLYKDKGSKFLSFAHPIIDVDDAKRIVDSYRKQYHDARHVCYAYIVGTEKQLFRANDDGEPSGTAGKPILGQIHALELTNTIVVVVRYFGGILLGTGGLTVAYREATRDALSKAQIVTKDITKRAKVSFPIDKTNEVMRLIRSTQATIVSQDYTDRYIYLLDIPNASVQSWRNTEYTIKVDFADSDIES